MHANCHGVAQTSVHAAFASALPKLMCMVQWCFQQEPEGRSDLIQLPPDFDEAAIIKEFFKLLREGGGITLLHLHVPKSRLR
jgi:hypothetical protein